MISRLSHQFVLKVEDPRTVVFYDNPVPVLSGMKLLGFANLTQDSTGVYADISMEYTSPERLDIENGKKLYLLPRCLFLHWQTYPDLKTVPGTCIVTFLKVEQNTTDPNREPMGPIESE